MFDATDGERSLSRREFTLGAGGLGALALTGAGAYTSTGNAGVKSEREQTYLVRQGKLRWEVTPLSHGGDTIDDFYSYQSETESANPLTSVIEDDAASRLFLYAGPVDSSLAFLHGGPNTDHGGRATFAFSGLSRSTGEWAVRDDPPSVDDDFKSWENGNSTVKWAWDAGETDGGAFWGINDAESAMTVTPKTLEGVDSWRVVTGELGDLRRFELSTEKPVKVRRADGKRSVKRVNVDVMPESSTNSFDPYANDRIRVAVEKPPKGSSHDDWADPRNVDPGNYSVSFGSRDYLAGGNGASPQKHFRRDGALVLEYKTSEAHLSLDSTRGFLVGKTGDSTWFRGSDVIHPGGVDHGSPLAVTDVHANPAGADAKHLDEEYVEFGNTGESTVDLGGYTVTDEAGWAFHFPDDFTLGAGGRVRLHTGSGQWTDTDLYWGLDTPVWNNDTDTVTVTDASGKTVLRDTYS